MNLLAENLFPAGAGMNRTQVEAKSVPRRRGDEPGVWTFPFVPVPRRRGDEPKSGGRTVPRRRGDEPIMILAVLFVGLPSCSPQARG